MPRGRPTLACGSAGAGETLFSVEFLVSGIEMGENGVFMAFEETAAELSQNVASLGFDLAHLEATGKLVVDFVRVVLVSATAGSGKTSVATDFVRAACRRGERCLFFAFEESPQQLTRNMSSIGHSLGPWRKQGV